MRGNSRPREKRGSVLGVMKSGQLATVVKKKELSVILMQGEAGDMEIDGGSEVNGGCAECVPEENGNIQLEISLNSVVGISNPKTLKLLGKCRGKKS